MMCRSETTHSRFNVKTASK